MRFLNPGPSSVLKALLDGRESTPVNALNDVQPSLEVRALRPWEFFHERIIPFTGTLSSGASAGNISSIFLAAGLLDVKLKNCLLILHKLQNRSAQSIEVAANDANFAFTGSAGSIFSRDSRWGGLQGLFAFLAGAQAAPNAGRSPLFAITGNNELDLDYVIQIGNDGTMPYSWGIVGVTVNTAILVTVTGWILTYPIRGQ